VSFDWGCCCFCCGIVVVVVVVAVVDDAAGIEPLLSAKLLSDVIPSLRVPGQEFPELLPPVDEDAYFVLF
jgi:hypothetical protein